MATTVPNPPSLRLTNRDVLRAWWPLAASWLLMGLELPAISAAMARLPHPAISLAAYGGIIFPLALIIEAPIIMLLAASTALAKDTDAYGTIRRFMYRASGVLTLLHIAVAFTPLYDVVVEHLLASPEEIREAGRMGLMIMTPWTFSIAYRRMQQGVLIRFGRAGLVGTGTLVRLAANLVVIAIGLMIPRWPGIVVGTAAVAAGVMSEAIFAGIMVRPVLRGPLREAPLPPVALNMRRFLDFYVPLAMTSLLLLIGMPLASAAVGRMPRALESLAVWPVVNGFVFMLRSVGFALNEVVVSLMERPGAAPVLRRFGYTLALTMSGVLILVAATPLGGLWFRHVTALSPTLTLLAGHGLWVSLLMPGLSAMQSWFQGVLVHARRTRAVSEAVVVYLVTAVVTLGVAIAWGRMTGLYAGLGSMVIAALAQTLWLRWRAGSPLREMNEPPFPKAGITGIAEGSPAASA